MAEKAMHDRDYRTQLERAAYGHGKPKEFSGPSAEIKKSMAAIRPKHMNDEKKAGEELHRPVYKVAEDRDMVVSRQTTTMNGEGCMPGLSEANVRDTRIFSWARKGQWRLLVSLQACWGLIF